MGYRFLWGFRFPLPTRSSVVTPAELLVPPETSMLQGDFPATAPAANPVFYRTYSRKTATGRESWKQVVERNLAGLKSLGQLNDDEIDLMRRMQLRQASLPSGRWLWIGGTPWIEKPENFSGAYNCTSTNLVDWEAFGLMMDLAMMAVSYTHLTLPTIYSV